MTVINAASANSRGAGNTRRDHIQVFREFLDHLGRFAREQEASGSGVACNGSRASSQA